MPSAASTSLRVELIEAIEKLKPQIRGLHHRAMLTDITAELMAFIQKEIADHERRRDLCQAAVDKIDVLEADGYPDMDKQDLPLDQFNELQRIEADDAAADAEFEATPPASKVTIGLGTPVVKPTT